MLMSPVLSVFESLFFKDGLLEMPEGPHVDLVTHSSVVAPFMPETSSF